jgi:D-psicose/D-tagatose/L-ribulose 3-epimerase
LRICSALFAAGEVNMKIGLNLWIWESPFRTDRHLGLLEKVKGMRAEVVEFAYEDGGLVEPPVLRRALADQGLKCSVIGLFGIERDLASKDARQRQNGVDFAREVLEVCAESGVDLFSAACVGVGGTEVVTDRERPDRLKSAAESLHQIGEFAAKAGVRYCVEILNRYEDNLVNTCAEACELIEMTGHPSVGIHLDTFHMNIEEGSMGDALRLAGDHLFHLHASDTHRGAPGGGHLNWKEIAEALRDINYSGFAVIESFNPCGRLAPSGRAWHPYAESQDILAKEGLAFLRDNLLN